VAFSYNYHHSLVLHTPPLVYTLSLSHYFTNLFSMTTINSSQRSHQSYDQVPHVTNGVHKKQQQELLQGWTPSLETPCSGPSAHCMTSQENADFEPITSHLDPSSGGDSTLTQTPSSSLSDEDDYDDGDDDDDDVEIIMHDTSDYPSYSSLDTNPSLGTPIAAASPLGIDSALSCGKSGRRRKPWCPY
jgi:hypothetical protein